MKTVAALALAAICACSIEAVESGPRRGPPITCPKELRSTGTLIVGLGPRHGSEMAILRKSDSTLFVLVSKDKVLMMPSKDFATVPLMQFNVDAEFPAGDGEIQRMFSSPGEYEVIVSNDLTDPARGHRCTIQFTG